MTMPRMTGLVLAEEVRKIREDIVVILCSGYLDRVTEQHGADVGVQAILAKPFTVSELAATVRTALDNRPARRS